MTERHLIAFSLMLALFISIATIALVARYRQRRTQRLRMNGPVSDPLINHR